MHMYIYLYYFSCRVSPVQRSADQSLYSSSNSSEYFDQTVSLFYRRWHSALSYYNLGAAAGYAYVFSCATDCWRYRSEKVGCLMVLHSVLWKRLVRNMSTRRVGGVWAYKDFISLSEWAIYLSHVPSCHPSIHLSNPTGNSINGSQWFH